MQRQLHTVVASSIHSNMQNTAYISDLLKQVTFKEGAKLLHFKDYTGKSGYIAIKAPAGNVHLREP